MVTGRIRDIGQNVLGKGHTERYAMFATFAIPSGHTGCDSYETAEKSNIFFFLSSLVQDGRQVALGK